jgi:SlyX protein
MSMDLEERIAHLERLTEELSDIVAEQARELNVLKARATYLLEREAEREAENSGGVIIGDERPPHY